MRHRAVTALVCGALLVNWAELHPVGVAVVHKKPTVIRFGEGMPRVVRPRVGHDVLAAGVRLHGVDYQDVTQEEFDLWILAGSPEDVDAFLEGIR